ncbi:hypothetical protein GCM10022231_31820 [Gordonia caeni]|uniref:Uncharacterized protein n=1 Tax=Gordonia caeni TaxID=1007097 RepID=A0ABP7PN05_9ACTN
MPEMVNRASVLFSLLGPVTHDTIREVLFRQVGSAPCGPEPGSAGADPPPSELLPLEPCPGLPHGAAEAGGATTTAAAHATVTATAEESAMRRRRRPTGMERRCADRSEARMQTPEGVTEVTKVTVGTNETEWR